ncbi:hypothetical protein [Stenotrophomonas phage CM2]
MLLPALSRRLQATVTTIGDKVDAQARQITSLHYRNYNPT